MRVKGSDGAGNITSAPWIATFNKKITESATQGFYVVYLFSVDLKRLYLSLAFGTTQFEEYFSGRREQFAHLRSAARHLQQLLHVTEGLELGALELLARPRDRLHLAYQQANIAAIAYNLEDLPSDLEMENDYRRMIQVYDDLVSNPLLPSIEDLLESETSPPLSAQQPDVSTFVPRTPIIKKEASSRRSPRRYSESSKRIGDQGERIVFEYEKSKAAKLGHRVDAVRWLANEGNTPGWDIASLNLAGEQILIEVKSSVGSRVSSTGDRAADANHIWPPARPRPWLRSVGRI